MTGADATAPVAQLRDVGLRYRKTRALEAVSLDIPAGCMAGVIGPDGVGKSSLLALIAGARAVQTGRVVVLGSDLAKARHRKEVGPRIAYAMALDGLFFTGTDRVHDRMQTPHVAILVQAVVAGLLVLVLRRFPSLLDYTTFAIVLATMADVTALYALRLRQPKRRRPYRAWGYPTVPALYLLANAGIAIAMAWGRPKECAIALAVASTGVPFYFWFRRSIAS